MILVALFRPGRFLDWGDEFVYILGVVVLALLLVWGLAFVWWVVHRWRRGRKGVT